MKSQTKQEDEEEKITLEQFIETARHQLPPSSELKPVTADSFTQWHKAKKNADEEQNIKKKELAKEKGTGITGREFFLSGEYKEEEEEEDGENWDLTQFRKELEDAKADGESFQLGVGNPQVNEETTTEQAQANASV